MFPRISRNSSRILAVLSQHRMPSQIAWGVAIGIMIGLIPKDNLVALSLVVMIACLRVNQLASCLTAFVVHLLGGMVAPLTIAMGTSLQSQPFVLGSIETLYRLPLLPWSCLENASVLGGIGLGLITLIPTYAFCRWSLSRARHQLEHRALEQVADHAIEYRKTVAEHSRKRQDKSPPSLTLVAAIDGETKDAQADRKSTPLLKRVESGPEAVKDAGPDSRGSSTRAERKIQQRVMPTIFTGETNWEGTDTLLRETVIEVVRYKRPNVAGKPQADSSQHSLPAATLIQGNSMPTANAADVNAKDTTSNKFSNANKSELANPAIAFDSGHTPGQSNGRDESLRYLLWHINGTRENVRKSSEKTA
jgi:uncharacterized protein (TIGR03546 family)